MTDGSPPLPVPTRAPSTFALARLPAGLQGWTCASINLEGEDSVVVRFKAVSGADWLEVTVGALGQPGTVFCKLAHCQARYRGQIGAATPARKAEFAAIVMGIARAIDARLASTPGATIAEALGRSRETRRIVYGREAILDLLAPEILEGVPVADGWCLADVVPSSNVLGLKKAPLDLVLDFRRPSDAKRAMFIIGPRDDDKQAFARTEHFSLGFLTLSPVEPAGIESLRMLVAFVLQLRDHRGLDLVFPESVERPPPLALAAPAPEEVPQAEPSATLNLAISSECSQSCSFCTIKETSPAEDGGDLTFARLQADLAQNRRRGIRALRLNGYDPLTYSRIIDVLRYATEVGYDSVAVYSPCTTLADPAFCDAVIAALPPDVHFHVPLYGTDPAVHDAVTGRPGSHALVMAAIDNLSARVGRERVGLLSVATKLNLGELGKLAAFADERGFHFSTHMPYPSFESRADRFYAASPRQTEVIAALRRSLPGKPAEKLLFFLEGIAPCVKFNQMRDSGIPIKKWLFVPEKRPLIPGTEYRDPRYRHRGDEAPFHAASVPCPHAASCALLPACYGEFLRGYVDLYGLDEFSPISLSDVVAAT